MKLAIIAVAYNRISSLNRLLTSLCSASYSELVTLIISIDKSKTTEVEEFAEAFEWRYGEKRVVKHAENLGLRKHMLSLGQYFDEFDALVVLEDDITVAPSFFYYTQQCVAKYKDDDNIAGISLYNFPLNYQNRLPFQPLQSDSDVYLMQCAQSWGQVWMRKQWQDFRDWYDKNNEEFSDMPHLPHAICSWPKSSWLKYHTRYVIEQNKFFVYPYVSLSTNNSDAGTHVAVRDTSFQTCLLYGIKKAFNLNPTICYDGFFENLSIPLPVEDVCIDFYGEKQNRGEKRYWLTTERKAYKVVKSYALELKPYEWNVIANRMGNDIFLYDTTIAAEKKSAMPYSIRKQFLFNHPFDNLSLFKYAIKNLLHIDGVRKK